MFKNINKIFVAAVLVAFVLTSCTDEEEIIKGSTKTNSKNNKVLVTEKQPYEICQYPEYDDNDYDETTMMHYIEDFDRLMRTGESEVQTYDLTKSVAVLEFYYNYAVVDKQTEYDESIEYDPQIFEFTVPLYEGEINVTELSDAYREFLNEVLETMGNKYLMYSNIYVETKTSNSVTFGLLTKGNKPYGLGRIKLLRDPNDVTIPGGVSTDWNPKIHMSPDYIIRALALKPTSGLATSFITLNNQTIMQAQDHRNSLGTYNTTQYQPDLVFTANNLLPGLIDLTIARSNHILQAHYWQYANRYISDVIPARYSPSLYNVKEVSFFVSSIEICRFNYWNFSQIFLDSLIFVAN